MSNLLIREATRDDAQAICSIYNYEVENETGAILYKTTSYFLERLGLNALSDLPPLAPHLPDIDGLDEILDSLTD